MKKLLFLITAVAFLFTACEKDNQQNDAVQNAAQDVATIEFKIDQTDFGYKNTVPMCDDELGMSYVKFTVLDSAQVTTTYKSMIYYIGGEMLTQVIKLPVGTYQVTSFVVYNDNGTPDDENDDTIVRAAPLPGSEYWDLMQFKLNLEFTVDAFYKKQYEIDVLCFEELFYNEFGFTWFEFNDVRIEYQCIFGDICVDDYDLYMESLYANQLNGIQFDMPAIFEIKVFKGEDEEALRTFSNAEWYGEGQCLEVYWPNRLDEEGEVFNFELWVLLPTSNGFDYVLIDTWTFLDGEGATTGADGVVDFVIGDCHLYPADYEYEYTMGEGYGPLHDPVLEIQFDEEMHYSNMHITSDGSFYYTIDGGSSNGHINKYDLALNLVATYNINIDGRGLSYNKADGFLYASLFTGDVVKITDLASGTWVMVYDNKLQNNQASFALSEDGTKFYDFFQGNLIVWDLATGTLLETIGGLGYGPGNFGGNACVAVDPDYIYTWDATSTTVYIYDHAGTPVQTMVLGNGDNGHSLSFVDGILFVNDDTYFNGIGTWYGYNIRNDVAKSAIIINHSQSNTVEDLNPESSTTQL